MIAVRKLISFGRGERGPVSTNVPQNEKPVIARTRESSLAEKAFLQSWGMPDRLKTIFAEKNIEGSHIWVPSDKSLNGQMYFYTAQWALEDVPYPLPRIVYFKFEDRGRLEKPDTWPDKKWKQMGVTADVNTKTIYVHANGFGWLEEDGTGEDKLTDENLNKMLNEAIDDPAITLATEEQFTINGRTPAQAWNGREVFIFQNQS